MTIAHDHPSPIAVLDAVVVDMRANGDTGHVENLLQAREDVAELIRLRDKIADLFQIGSAVRLPSTIMANIENCKRRSECLWSIEREFFTFEVPDEDGEDGEMLEDCDLSWGADPDEYVEQFHAALARIRSMP